MVGYNDRRKGAIMLVYKSVYKWEEGVCLGEVLDFPGTVSFGHTLDEARARSDRAAAREALDELADLVHYVEEV